MNIIVCAKQIVNVTDIRIDKKTNKPVLQGLDNKISDIDKNAVEEAIRVRDEKGGKVTIIMVGPSEATETVKELLAMGADEALLIPWDQDYDYHVVSELLIGGIKKLGDYDIILCGEASLDLFSGQIGPRVAELLDIPQITYAQEIGADDEKVVGDRNLGDSIVTVESSYPVLITVTKEINEPRLPSLMDILGAANKPIEILEADDVVSEVSSPTVETIDITGVSMDRKNIIYEEMPVGEAVSKLVESLGKEGVI